MILETCNTVRLSLASLPLTCLWTDSTIVLIVGTASRPTKSHHQFCASLLLHGIMLKVLTIRLVALLNCGMFPSELLGHLLMICGGMSPAGPDLAFISGLSLSKQPV